MIEVSITRAKGENRVGCDEDGDDDDDGNDGDDDDDGGDGDDDDDDGGGDHDDGDDGGDNNDDDDDIDDNSGVCVGGVDIMIMVICV